MKISLAILSAILLFAPSAPAHDWSWQPGTITLAEIRQTDHPVLAHLGKYLYLGRKNPPRPDPNKGVWNMAKMNIPDRWEVTSIDIGRTIVTLVTSAGTFAITSQNLEPLQTAIGALGRSPGDDALQQAWVTHAFLKSNPPSSP